MSIINETVLSLDQAAAALPGFRGKPLSKASVWRWCRIGLKVPSGERLRLDHVRLGSRLLTSSEALARFADRLTAADIARFEPDRQPSTINT